MKRTLFVLLMFLSATVSAEMYRWVDAQGKVHYSDEPPPAGAKSTKTIATPPPPAAPSAGATAPKSWQEKEMEFQKRQSDKAEAEAKKKKEEADAKVKKDNCDMARKRLEMLQSGQRVVTTNDKGEREVMDDPGRQKAIADAQKDVASWCK